MTPIDKMECPTNLDLMPCTCKLNSDSTGLELVCSDQDEDELGDEKMSKILKDFRPRQLLVALRAQKTGITKIPVEISRFPKLSYIDFGFNSKLTSIRTDAFQSQTLFDNVEIHLAANGATKSILTDAFNYPNAKSVKVELSSSSINSIAPGAFKGKLCGYE